MAKRLSVLVAAIALVATAALIVHRTRATAFSPPIHTCPSVPTLRGFTRGYPLVIQARNVSCAEALTIVRARNSNVGVTFVGNPAGPAAQFRWKLSGLPGWTCYGDGSGFPGHGMGGDCSKGGAAVEWYHA